MLVDGLLTSCLTFQGTRRELVSSVIRHSFLLPGDRVPLSNTNTSIPCGSTYGQRIYSSHLATFSLSYSGRGAYATAKVDQDGLKLIVCLTMMGISAALSRDDDWRNHKEAQAGSNGPREQIPEKIIVRSLFPPPPNISKNLTMQVRPTRLNYSQCNAQKLGRIYQEFFPFPYLLSPNEKDWRIYKNTNTQMDDLWIVCVLARM